MNARTERFAAAASRTHTTVRSSRHHLQTVDNGQVDAPKLAHSTRNGTTAFRLPVGQMLRNCTVALSKMFAACLQNLSSIFRLVYDAQVSQCGQSLQCFAGEFVFVNFRTCSASNHLRCTARRVVKFSAVAHSRTRLSSNTQHITNSVVLPGKGVSNVANLTTRW